MSVMLGSEVFLAIVPDFVEVNTEEVKDYNVRFSHSIVLDGISIAAVVDLLILGIHLFGESKV